MKGGDYRSKGVHTNRDTTAKMKVKPYDRFGGAVRPTEKKARTTVDAIQTALNAGGGRIPTTKEVPAGKMTEAIGKKAVAQANMTQPKKQGPNTGQVATALAKGASDMAAQNRAAQAQFDAEHQRAVAEGSAMHQRMRQGTPGKAMSIIKNKRV